VRRAAASVAVLSLALVALPPTASGVTVSSSGATSSSTAVPATAAAGTYVVVLRARPLATYHGGVAGLAATAPRPGDRFDARTAAARAYREYLVSRQDRVLSSLGRPRVLYSYTVAVDGFAAVLTSRQVKRAEALPGVLGVQRSTTARLAGLTSAPGVADRAAASPPGATRHPPGARGRGVVIGVIDSGIWPENPSFAAVPVTHRALSRDYPGFTGTCGAAERWTASLCNAKVVAARYFVRGFGRDRVAVADYVSPRDGSGHGSRTASLAAGNAGVDVTIDRQGFGRISGAAPAAALAVYKACWAAPDPRNDGCATADTVAAIDRAVGDGVDVISYSIGDGDGPGTLDAVEAAFENAARSGVFVATSAGDGGPGVSTVAHSSPWVTTVAATSYTVYRGAVVVGDGRRYSGSMVSDRRVGPVRLVSAEDARASGSSVHDAALCYPGSLDASAVHRAIVICRRGETARVSKSLSVAQAGGIGMILVNTTSGSTDADVHAVPTVQVSRAAGAAIAAYATRHARATAALVPAATGATQPPRLATFSGRGPAAGAAVVKPDVAAPGVAVVSAVAPPSNLGRHWDLASGTSVAAPQVAGLAADLIAAHRAWSPAAVGSALITTARPLSPSVGPLSGGAGEVNHRRALDPGLVYAPAGLRWANLASVSVANLVSTRTVTRRVTNVGGDTETYTAHVRGLAGLSTAVSPETITLAPGESRRFSISFAARRTARYDRFVNGSLTWSGSGGHRVTSPIVVRAAYLAAPAEVTATGERGRLDVTARAGVTGTITSILAGPVAARPVSLRLAPATFDPARPGEAAAWSHRYGVGPGTAALRFEVAARAGRDVDLYLYRDGALEASAVSPAARERLTLTHPVPGHYTVYVVDNGREHHGRATAASFTGWVLPQGSRAATASLTRRTAVTGGRAFSVGLTWSGLSTSHRWFGQISYEHSAAVSYLTVN
jgi:hypothetical protein